MSQVRTRLKPLAAALAVAAYGWCGPGAPAWGQDGAADHGYGASSAPAAPGAPAVPAVPAVNLALAAAVVGDLHAGQAPDAVVSRGMALGLSASEIVGQVAMSDLPWCIKITATIEADPDGTEAIVEAAVREGEPVENVISCALEAGGDPDAVANGADLAGADPVVVADVVEALQTAAIGEAELAEGTIDCPAIEAMVRKDPSRIDEIVDVAIRAGFPEEASIACAARQLAALGPTATAGGPDSDDPSGETEDPSPGDGQIIRPPDPPSGPPDAASPT